MKSYVAALLGLVSLVLAPAEAHACASATQHRLLPLGACGDAVIAVEVSQQRDSADLPPAWWSVQARLVRVDRVGGATTVLSPLGRFEQVPDGAAYDRRLERLIGRAMGKARRLPGFEAATMIERVDCRHLRQCAGVSAEVSDGRLLVRADIGGVYPIPADRFSSLYADPGDYAVARVRTYAAGEYTWRVVDVGAGDPRCESYVDPGARRACRTWRPLEVDPLPIADSGRLDEPLHHGNDFAVVLWR